MADPARLPTGRAPTVRPGRRPGWHRGRGLRAALAAALLLVPAEAARAQDTLLTGNLPPGLSDLVNEGLRQLSAQPDLGSADLGDQLAPAATQPAPGAAVPAGRLSAVRTVRPLTAIEQDFTSRAGRELRLIGYDAFGVVRTVTASQSGGIQDSYILGPGDEVVVVLRGQVNRTLSTRIGREGTVVLPDLAPVPAAGLTFGAFRDLVQQQIDQNYIATQAFVSLGAIRQVTVLVNGEVASPGQISLSGLNSVVDALSLSGGIRPTGTLRDLQVVRGGETRQVDLYDLILAPSPDIDLSIAEGDRIFVPVIGATVAVTGEVKRPGIFELPPGETAVTAAALLGLGGGTLGRGPFRFQVLRLQPDGRERLVEIPAPGPPGTEDGAEAVRDGDILFVEPRVDVRVGEITLAGHVTLPGPYPIGSVPTVAALLDPEDLLPDPYLPFAVIESTDPGTRARDFSGFDLGAVLRGAADVRLRDDDRVLVLGRQDIDFLTSAGVQRALRGEVPLQAADCAGLDYLARWVRGNPEGALASGQFGTAVRDLQGGSLPCPALFDESPELLTFLLRNSLLVRGNVLRPGAYPVVGPGQSGDVLSIAGSDGGGADVSVIAAGGGSAAAQEVVEVEDARVTLVGHVRFPGSRALGSAPTLSGLLGRLAAYREDPYLLLGLISRVSPETLQREVVPFSPASVSSGRADLALRDGDVVRVFGAEEMRTLVRRLALPEAEDVPQTPPPATARPTIEAEQRLSDVEALRQALGAAIASSAASGGAAGGTTGGLAGTGAAAGLAPGDLAGLAGSSDLLSSLASSPAAQQALGSVLQTPEGQQLVSQALATGTIDPAVVQQVLSGQAGVLPALAGAGAQAAARPSAELSLPDESVPVAGTDAALIETYFPRALVATLLRDQSVDLLGEALLPGRYPVAGSVTLDSLLLAGGGMTLDADTSAVELTRYQLDPVTSTRRVERSTLDLRSLPAASIALQPGDVVRLNPIISDREEGFVEMAGEVRRPGSYDIVQGERLSSLLARAGGLTPVAYPYGAVFTRDSVRRAELEASARFQQELNRSLPGLLVQAREQDIDISASDIGGLQLLLSQTQANPQAAGRMVIEADPNVLQVRPELDVVLEPGDRLFVPRRPLSVFVAGQVFNQGAQQFLVGRSVADYVEAAGGLTSQADRSTIFIIRPNGLAEQASLSAWRSGPSNLLPGSTIVVPSDLTPFSFFTFIDRASDIVTRAAVAVATTLAITDR